MTRHWQDFRSLLQDSQNILISSHAKADGDAIGSELALAVALRKLGYRVTVVNPDAPAVLFQFMGKDYDAVRFYDGRKDNPDGNPRRFTLPELAEYDALIVVDTSARVQLRSVAELIDTGIKTIVIDHHAVSEKLTPYDFSDSSQPAAGCLIMELIEALGIPLQTREEGATCSIADFLFFAIATDTGWFRFPSVLPETFQQASRLVSAGASSSRFYQLTYENNPPERLKLLGVLAQNSVLECDGRLAYSWLKREDFARFDATPNNTPNLVNTLLMTEGVEVAILFTEADGKIWISFRSRGDYDVAEFAHRFGGGGHKNASGVTILSSATLEEIVRQVVESAIEENIQNRKDRAQTKGQKEKMS